MARKPSRVRRELRAQAELFNSVRSSVLSEALSKSDPFVPASSAGFRSIHLTINSSLGYLKAPPANIERTIRARKGLGPVASETGLRLPGLKPVQHGKSKAPVTQRFSEPAMTKVVEVSKIRTGTRGKTPRWTVLGLPGIFPKDGGRK